MGVVGSKITRTLRRFNIESRTEKLIEKHQRVADPAPKHPTTVKVLSRLKEEHPEYLEAQFIKHEKLNENLKQIYVQSKGALPQISADKPLPQQRGMAEETELGAMETKYVVREGRVNLKNVLSFLNSHQLNPKEVTAEKIAQEMKLDQTQVENVLKYFRIFHLHIPKEMFEKNRKFEKLYKQQIAAAEKNPLSFRLPGDMLRDSLKLGQNDSKLKEVKSENLDLPKT